MTDQIPAEDVREIVEKMRYHANHDNVRGSEEEYVRFFADRLEALLPPPTRPTLADMTREERRECQWMQCEVNGEIRVITLIREGNDHAVTLAPSGFTFHCPPEKVTPRPDLPRLEWPGTGQDGEEATRVDYVPVAGGRTAYGPWTVARLRKKPDTVPLNTLAMGSEWDDADALTRACEESGRDQITVTDRDGDVSVWDADTRWWGTGAPDYGFEPYTILHAGKKADQ